MKDLFNENRKTNQIEFLKVIKSNFGFFILKAYKFKYILHGKLPIEIFPSIFNELNNFFLRFFFIKKNSVFLL